MLGEPFKNIDTVKKLCSYLERIGALNTPVEIKLGFRWEKKMDGLKGKQKRVKLKVTFMFIPIGSTAKSILKHSECWSVCLFDVSSDDCAMFDYQDGSNYHSHRLRRQLPSDDDITVNLLYNFIMMM